MRSFNHKNNDLKIFEQAYDKQIREILVLTSDSPACAGKSQGDSLWTVSKAFLAYVDVHTNELMSGDGRLVWPITEKQERDNYEDWRGKFKGGCIYRILGRELMDKTVPEGRLPSYCNSFLVVDVLETNAKNKQLRLVLEEYRKPVIIHNDTLGAFELNKDLGLFGGKINWLGKEIDAFLEIEKDSPESWTNALNVLAVFAAEQETRDPSMKRFAAEELTELANDWNENDEKISQEAFAERISISSVTMCADGDYTVYFHDDDLFLGHVVVVYGDMDEGPKEADIEG